MIHCKASLSVSLRHLKSLLGHATGSSLIQAGHLTPKSKQDLIFLKDKTLVIRSTRFYEGAYLKQSVTPYLEDNSSLIILISFSLLLTNMFLQLTFEDNNQAKTTWVSNNKLFKHFNAR